MSECVKMRECESVLPSAAPAACSIGEVVSQVVVKRWHYCAFSIGEVVSQVVVERWHYCAFSNTPAASSFWGGWVGGWVGEWVGKCVSE